METKKRSIIKSVSWRILSTLTTILIVFIVTKNKSFAISIGAFEMIIKILVYYFHERVWLNYSWGVKN